MARKGAEAAPPTLAADHKKSKPKKKFVAPNPGTLAYDVLESLKQRMGTDKSLVKRIQQGTNSPSASGIRTRRRELVDAGFVEHFGANGRGEKIWRVVPEAQRKCNEINSKARSARPESPNVTMSETKEEGKQVVLKLSHCGELMVQSKDIVGWWHPIPIKLWRRIVGFHHAISKASKAESVSYHRWNPKTEEYDTIIPYQVSAGRGLAVSTNWEDPKNVELLNRYAAKHGQEFFPACTIHTHVDASAFESGTDAGDETDLPGWHITIGHLLTYPDMHLHCLPPAEVAEDQITHLH